MITGGWSEEGREKEQSLQPPAAHGPQPRPPRVPANNRGGPGRAEPSQAGPSRAKPQRSAGALQAAPAGLLAGGGRSLGPPEGKGGRPRPPAPAPPRLPGVPSGPVAPAPTAQTRPQQPPLAPARRARRRPADAPPSTCVTPPHHILFTRNQLGVLYIIYR